MEKFPKGRGKPRLRRSWPPGRLEMSEKGRALEREFVQMDLLEAAFDGRPPTERVGFVFGGICFEGIIPAS
jgi:hypothetical protein